MAGVDVASWTVPAPATSYWQATRHPWPCLLFVLPLVIAYEAGVVCLGEGGETIRNGADAWLRWLLAAVGLPQFFWAPVGLTVGLAAWNWQRRRDRPRDVLGVCSGMALESVLFALALWGVSRQLAPLLHQLGIALAAGSRNHAALAQLFGFLGAGIYEEALFRLVLLWGVVWLLELAHVPRRLALVPAVVLASVSFAAVHHLGAAGEPFDAFVFLFRTLAGLYFALLLLFRGFGVAVGTHACYDIFVGVAT
jgi:hypothetical protein